jgi:hypothetical protein
VGEWFSIEVFDGGGSARLWRDVYGDPLIYAAQLWGATDWSWHEHSWGVILELELDDEESFERLRDDAAFRAALDAVPDPVGGLLVHRGRGGSAGDRRFRRPRPTLGAGALALPVPELIPA